MIRRRDSCSSIEIEFAELHIFSIITSTPNIGKELGDGHTQVALALAFSRQSRLSPSRSSNHVITHQVSAGDC